MRSLTAVLAAALVLLPAAPAWAAGQAPVAVDDAVTYRNIGGIDYLVNALANDSDLDGDTLTYTAVTPATKGNAYLLAGKLYYNPTVGNIGTDSFTYTVSDGQGNTATGTVTATLWVDPPAPGGVSISGSDVGSATVSWTAPAGAASYRIYRNGLLVAGTSGLTFTDNSLVATGSYRFEITALNGGGFEGPRSTTVYRQAQLLTPTGLAVDITDDPAKLSVTWSAGGKVGPWNVYRDGALLTSVMTPAFEDTGLVTGREYSYQVQHAFSTSTVVQPPSPLSGVVRGTPVVLSSINRLFWDLGWKTGDLGAITVPERAIPGGRQQDHQSGLILQQDGQTAFAVRRPLSIAYISAGGAGGDLGFPVAERETGLRDGGLGQTFEGGSIWSSTFTPPRAVRLAIEDGWAASGWEEGPLGYPVGAQVTLPGGVWQAFEDGAVYWSAATGSHGVSGPIGDLYRSVGGPAGGLRYPTTDENCGLRDGGCYQLFQGGAIYWSPATGAGRVFGAIGDLYMSYAGPNGGLAYPISGEICALRGGGCYQLFQGGAIYWSPATGAHRVYGAMRDAWARKGLEGGGLGYPLTDETCGLRGGGCYQLFQGGSVYWSPATGAHPVLGAIRDAWARQGLENGRLGYPTSDESNPRGAYRQSFQHGVISFSAAGTQIAYW